MGKSDTVRIPVKGSLDIERDGNTVTYRMTCRDQYTAMEIYDRAVAAIRDGRQLRLSFNLGAQKHEP